MSIQDRKKDHIDLTISDQTQYDHSSGFDQFRFKHNALPEVNFDEIDTSASFLGRTFPFPLFISSMTGGYAGSTAINEIIAQFCEEQFLPFGVGSQRVLFDNPEEIESFKIVRKTAPSAFICANIGGAQLIGGLSNDHINILIDSIEANAIIVHLNPLQELMQPEGDRDFVGIRNGIEKLVHESPVPIIVKETGAGISGDVASQLIDSGVKVIDISGSGGTSWAKVENQRDLNENPQTRFDNWGIPTVRALEEVANLKWENSFEIIASGGIRSSHDVVKALCLGASCTAMAQPIIKHIHKGGIESLRAFYFDLQKEVKTIMCLLGHSSIEQLTASSLYRL